MKKQDLFSIICLQVPRLQQCFHTESWENLVRNCNSRDKKTKDYDPIILLYNMYIVNHTDLLFMSLFYLSLNILHVRRQNTIKYWLIYRLYLSFIYKNSEKIGSFY